MKQLDKSYDCPQSQCNTTLQSCTSCLCKGCMSHCIQVCCYCKHSCCCNLVEPYLTTCKPRLSCYESLCCIKRQGTGAEICNVIWAANRAESFGLYHLQHGSSASRHSNGDIFNSRTTKPARTGQHNQSRTLANTAQNPLNFSLLCMNIHSNLLQLLQSQAMSNAIKQPGCQTAINTQGLACAIPAAQRA